MALIPAELTLSPEGRAAFCIGCTAVCASRFFQVAGHRCTGTKGTAVRKCVTTSHRLRCLGAPGLTQWFSGVLTDLPWSARGPLETRSQRGCRRCKSYTHTAHTRRRGANTRDPSFCDSSSQGKVFSKAQPADRLSHVTGRRWDTRPCLKCLLATGTEFSFFVFPQPHRLCPEFTHCPTRPV